MGAVAVAVVTAKEAVEAQARVCTEKHHPHFAPRDGVCWNCRRFIYALEAGQDGADPTGPVTGCPHCHRSYCD